MVKESKFQKQFRDKVEAMFENCKTFKQDEQQQQGIPDVLILCNDKWAMVECKDSKDAKHRPNQDHYVDKYNKWSFAAFVYPENEQEVLDGLEKLFKPQR